MIIIELLIAVFDGMLNKFQCILCQMRYTRRYLLLNFWVYVNAVMNKLLEFVNLIH